LRKLFALSFAVAVTGGGVATSTADAHFLWHHKHMTLERKLAYFKRSVGHDRKTIAWLGKVHKNLSHNVRALSSSRYGFAVRVYQELRWHKHALKWHVKLLAHYQAKWDKLHPPLPAHYSAWLCIHRYEGSWTDDGSPYYGGLQMDMEFQRNYGAKLLKEKGTANNWTPLEQMQVAEVAYQSGRGFYPWPNTARYCGLI
jgi:hypothetical protein